MRFSRRDTSFESAIRKRFLDMHSIPCLYDDLKISVLATPWEVLLFFDTIVFALTLYKAVEIWKSGPSSLIQVLVRDGKLVNLCILWAASIWLLHFWKGTVYYLSVAHYANLYNGTHIQELCNSLIVLSNLSNILSWTVSSALLMMIMPWLIGSIAPFRTSKSFSMLFI